MAPTTSSLNLPEFAAPSVCLFVCLRACVRQSEKLFQEEMGKAVGDYMEASAETRSKFRDGKDDDGTHLLSIKLPTR